MESGKLTFITGGVRSGKSSFAEQIAIEHAKSQQMMLHYIACGVPFDDEMKERMIRHKQDRNQADAKWTTWEQPTELVNIATHFHKKDFLLVDCITTLLNNYFFQERERHPHEILDLMKQDVISLLEQSGGVILVSNEVFQDLPHKDSLTWNYQYILGKLHQFIVEIADIAIVVESGIPIYKKGSLL